jgi:hypothetical protein
VSLSSTLPILDYDAKGAVVEARKLIFARCAFVLRLTGGSREDVLPFIKGSGLSDPGGMSTTPNLQALVVLWMLAKESNLSLV